MKKFSSFLIAALLLLSCVKQQKPVVEQPLPFTFDENLLLVDSLMQSDADSALRILLSMDKACLVPTGCHDSTSCTGKACLAANANNHYHSLLLSEALYKTDNAQYYRYVKTCHGASLHDAMHYFDSLALRHPNNDDITMLSARSHYMNGVGYYENDSVVEACKEYLHALEIMEDHFEEKQLVGFKAKFMGLTYTRLGEVYYNYGVANAAVASYNNALILFSKLNNYDLANTYRRMGGSYLLDNNNDSALYFYKKSVVVAKKHNNNIIYSASLSESAPVYYYLGYTDSAFMVIKKALILSQGEDQRMAQYFIYGSLLVHEHQYDSAIFYLEKSVNRKNYTTQTASAELLINCYQSLGDTIKAVRYKTIYSDYFTKFRGNSIIETELSKVYELNKREQLQKYNQKLSIKQNRQNVSILLVMLAIITISIIINRLKIDKTIMNTNKSIAEKNKALEDMKRKIETNTFISEPICKTILEMVDTQQFKSKLGSETYKEFALSKDQLLELRAAVDSHYCKFTHRLHDMYPDLSCDDIDYCCLYLLGLKDADISALMQRDYSTVCYRNRKIKNIIKSKKNLSETLNNLAD